jgi:hypothetical protein
MLELALWWMLGRREPGVEGDNVNELQRMAWRSQHPLDGLCVDGHGPFDVAGLLRSELTREKQLGKPIAMIIVFFWFPSLSFSGRRPFRNRRQEVYYQ